MGDVLLLNNDCVDVGIVITTVGTEVLFALGSRDYDTYDKLRGTPLVMPIRARDINGQGCAPCIHE
jgi:hypothetical protein